MGKGQENVKAQTYTHTKGRDKQTGQHLSHETLKQKQQCNQTNGFIGALANFQVHIPAEIFVSKGAVLNNFTIFFSLV